MRHTLICVVVLVLALAPQLAEAQGRGRPKAPKTTAAGDVAAGSASPTGRGAAAPAAAPGFRQFGAWLDDASGAAPGETSFGIGAGYWRSSGASLADVPIVDVSVGLTDRVRVSASVPFYRSTFDGVTSRGLDDVYLSSKFVAVDPSATESGFGLAVSPVLEILSAAYADDRVHWALPVSVELRRSPVRVYGSAGYFSRGSLFGGAALEYLTPVGTVLTFGLTQSFSTASEPSVTNAGRADVSVGMAQALGDAVSAWASFGRSLASPEGEGTTFGIAAGVSFTFSPPHSQP